MCAAKSAGPIQESILEASDASSRYSSVILTRTGLRTVSRERFVWSGWEALGQVELCPRYLIVTFNVKDAILGHCRLKASPLPVSAVQPVAVADAARSNLPSLSVAAVKPPRSFTVRRVGVEHSWRMDSTLAIFQQSDSFHEI
jgi:hypothetical protein